MQHGMHNTIQMVKVQQDLMDQQLKYHYLVADHKVRQLRKNDGAGFIATMRSLFAPRPALTQERGV